MYGIYANIGGILMGSMLPYIAYMDPMGTYTEMNFTRERNNEEWENKFAAPWETPWISSNKTSTSIRFGVVQRCDKT